MLQKGHGCGKLAESLFPTSISLMAHAVGDVCWWLRHMQRPDRVLSRCIRAWHRNLEWVQISHLSAQSRLRLVIRAPSACANVSHRLAHGSTRQGLTSTRDVIDFQTSTLFGSETHLLTQLALPLLVGCRYLRVPSDPSMLGRPSAGLTMTTIEGMAESALIYLGLFTVLLIHDTCFLPPTAAHIPPQSS